MLTTDRYQIAVRHAEKATLLWWKELFQRGLHAANSGDWVVQEYWTPRKLPGLWNGKAPVEQTAAAAFAEFLEQVRVQLMDDAAVMLETPIESVMICGLGFFAVEVCNTVMQMLLPTGVVRWCFSPAFTERLLWRRGIQLYVLLLATACMNDAEVFGKRGDWRPLQVKLGAVWESDDGCILVCALGLHVVIRLILSARLCHNPPESGGSSTAAASSAVSSPRHPAARQSALASPDSESDKVDSKMD